MPTKTQLDLPAIAIAVAKHLAGEWAPDPEYPRALAGPRGIRLLFTVPFGSPRGEVQGLLPPEAHRRLYLTAEDRKKLSIGVDLRRDPAAIAREVERRLLPGFEPLFHDCVERVAQDRAYEAGRAALYVLLEPLAPEGVRVEASTDTSVKLTASLGEAEARAVFEAIARIRGDAAS